MTPTEQAKTMVRRVAEALLNNYRARQGLDFQALQDRDPEDQAIWIADARAAIEALQDPPREFVERIFCQVAECVMSGPRFGDKDKYFPSKLMWDRLLFEILEPKYVPLAARKGTTYTITTSDGVELKFDSIEALTTAALSEEGE